MKLKGQLTKEKLSNVMLGTNLKPDFTFFTKKHEAPQGAVTSIKSTKHWLLLHINERMYQPRALSSSHALEHNKHCTDCVSVCVCVICSRTHRHAFMLLTVTTLVTVFNMMWYAFLF